MIWIVVVFIIFILVAEYTVLALQTQQFSKSIPNPTEHWTDYKAIVNRGRCSQNIARVIPMFQKALDPLKPSNPDFNWNTYFNGSKFSQKPVNIAFR